MVSEYTRNLVIIGLILLATLGSLLAQGQDRYSKIRGLNDPPTSERHKYSEGAAGVKELMDTVRLSGRGISVLAFETGFTKAQFDDVLDTLISEGEYMEEIIGFFDHCHPGMFSDDPSNCPFIYAFYRSRDNKIALTRFLLTSDYLLECRLTDTLSSHDISSLRHQLDPYLKKDLYDRIIKTSKEELAKSSKDCLMKNLDKIYDSK